MIRKLANSTKDNGASFGLLLLRLGAAFLMMYLHGIPKLTGYSERVNEFFDPFGIGSEFSLILVIFAECVCSILIALGLFTRLASVPLIVVMLVATFVFNAGEPLMAQEKSLLYLVVFICLFFSGGGRFSIDAGLKKGR